MRSSVFASNELIDLEPKQANILKEVLVGLSKKQKSIDPKFFYDEKGSELFENITDLPEYYPTRAENLILNRHAEEIAGYIGPDALVIEPGSGSGKKIRPILRKLENVSGYVPVEISKKILLEMTEELHEEFPHLRVMPICADFTQEMDFPVSVDFQSGKKVIFFPGSTIGNFHPHDAVDLLTKFSKLLGHGGGLLIGVDLKKDSDRLELAYDDPQGVTAAFNLNLLTRINRELDATFDLNNFTHKAFYNEELGRVEMHLVSAIPQLVRVNQTIFRFREGESIHTECSYKYSVEEFCELGAKAKLEIKKIWLDHEKLFCVYYFEKV